jgi:hypothetical protein
MENLKKGDFVRLITGSSKMKIHFIYGGSLVECEAKKGNGELKRYFFRPESLIRCSVIEEMKSEWSEDFFG